MINISVDGKELENAKILLAKFPAAFAKSAESAAKKSAGPFRQAAVNETSKNYFISPAKFKREIKAHYRNGTLSLFVHGPRHTLGSFMISPSKRPRKRMQGLHGAVKKHGGLKFFPTGFLLRNNLPFLRDKPGKKGIRAIYGPSYAQIMKQPDNILPVLELTKEKFLKNLNHEVLFRIGAFKK